MVQPASQVDLAMQSCHAFEKVKGLISEIIARNKEARTQALRLRRELENLMEEANMLGLVAKEEEEKEEVVVAT